MDILTLKHDLIVRSKNATGGKHELIIEKAIFKVMNYSIIEYLKTEEDSRSYTEILNSDLSGNIAMALKSLLKIYLSLIKNENEGRIKEMSIESEFKELLKDVEFAFADCDPSTPVKLIAVSLMELSDRLEDISRKLDIIAINEMDKKMM